MTNRQYEHLGRALCDMEKLTAMRGGMDDLCNDLTMHLCAFVGNDAACKWVKAQFGKNLALWHGGSDFIDAVREIVNNEEKKEIRK